MPFFFEKRKRLLIKRLGACCPLPTLLYGWDQGKEAPYAFFRRKKEEGTSSFQKNSVFLEEGEEGSYAFGGLTSFTTIFISINFHFIIIERL
jgi:hypothetical protein